MQAPLVLVVMHAVSIARTDDNEPRVSGGAIWLTDRDGRIRSTPTGGPVALVDRHSTRKQAAAALTDR